MNTLATYLTSLKAAFTRSEEGASMVEYGILVALIAVISVVAIQGIGSTLGTEFGTVDNCLDLQTEAACSPAT